MQFTRHEMPININIENDLLLWEIEVRRLSEDRLGRSRFQTFLQQHEK